jgi:hypothetical protein
MSVEIVCPQCGYSKNVPEEKIPPGVRWANCPRCKNRFELLLQKTADSNEPPWERRSEIGFWNSVYNTYKKVLFSPRRFFGSMGSRAGMSEPLAFGLLSGAAGAMGGLFWPFLVMSGSIQSLSRFDHIGMGLVLTAVLLSCIPYVLVVMVLTSLVLHGCLFLVSGGRNGYEATFRVVAYSQATQFLSIIPFIGGMAAFVWLIAIQIIGLREIHDTSYGRVVMAYLIPFISLLGIVAAAVIFLSAMFFR